MVLYLNKTCIPFTQPTLCQIWLKLAQWFWRRNFFNLVNIFSLSHNYLPLEKVGTLHLNELESPSTKDAFCHVWLKWFWRRRFLNFGNAFSLFVNYFPLEKGGALHLNKFDSPSPKDTLFQVRLELGQRFWRRRWKCKKFTTTPTKTKTTTTNNGQTLIRKPCLRLGSDELKRL